MSMSQGSLQETRPAHQSLYVDKIPTTFLLTNSVVLAGLEVIKVIPQNVSAFPYPHPLPSEM